MRKLHHGGCLILTNQESLPVSPGDLFAKSSTLSLISDTGPNKYGYNWALLAFVQALAHSTLAHLTLFDRKAARYTRVWAQLSVIDGIVPGAGPAPRT